MPLELAAKDRRQLKAMMAGGAQMTSRRWRRIRTLLLLADGLSARAAAVAALALPVRERQQPRTHDVANNVAGLAKGAKVYDVPTILTTVTAQRGGRLIEEVQASSPTRSRSIAHRSTLGRTAAWWRP